MMVVDDLDLVGVTFEPNEANPPLVVDPNGILTRTVTLQLFQPIPRNTPKLVKCSDSMKRGELLQCAALHIAGNSPRGAPGEKLCRLSRGEAFDHDGV